MATGVRVGITLACTECKRRNYQTTKSKRNTPDRVEFNKYCRWCGRHTPPRQTRSERRARRAAQAESKAALERSTRARPSVRPAVAPAGSQDGAAVQHR